MCVLVSAMSGTFLGLPLYFRASNFSGRIRFVCFLRRPSITIVALICDSAYVVRCTTQFTIPAAILFVLLYVFIGNPTPVDLLLFCRLMPSGGRWKRRLVGGRRRGTTSGLFPSCEKRRRERYPTATILAAHFHECVFSWRF